MENRLCDALSAQRLILGIPLDPIAEQVADESLADKIRTIGTAHVYSEYKFLQIENGTAHFQLAPQMVPDVNTTVQLTKNQSETYPGLTLFFSNNYGGDFNSQGNWIGFNLCIERVLIDGVQLDGFKPVFFRYEGTPTQ